MSRGRVQVDVLCSTSTNASSVQTTLLGFLTGLVQDTHPQPLVAVNEDGSWRVRGDLLFMTRAEADTYLSLVAANMATNARMLAGSRVPTHTCRHDEGIGYCTVDAVATK